MSNCILFIFEGAKTEPNITKNLCKHLIAIEGKRVVFASYGFNIYQLYKDTNDDPDLDIYELVVEQINKKSNPTKYDQIVLDIGDSENITDIYLFFDYDCHCTNADDDRLTKMLLHFDNPQSDGLLCISYPMVEAIRHQTKGAVNYITHATSDLRNYKSWINTQIAEGLLEPEYQNWSYYTLKTWTEIINEHLVRANQLTTDKLIFPEDIIEQSTVFKYQLIKHIPHNKVAVISAFPLMIQTFYGENLQNKLYDL